MSGALTPTILSRGKAIDPSWVVVSIDVLHEVDRRPWAELVMADGDAARRRFTLSESPAFELGVTIEIKLRYEGEADHTLFRGRVVRHAIEAGVDETRLRVELRDDTFRLDGPRRSAVLRDRRDDEVVRDLLDLAEVPVATLEPTGFRHPELVRYRATDWDFMLLRAQANGLCVTVEGGAVSLRKAELADAAEHRIEWGLDTVLDCALELDTAHQRGGVEGTAWSSADQRLGEPQTASEVVLGQDHTEPSQVAGPLGLGTETLTHTVPLSDDELATWADARWARRRLALVRGRLSLPGRTDVSLLQTLELAGLGERFDGRALTTGVRHRVTAGSWRTDLQLGLDPEPFARRPDIVDLPAAGLLPPAGALQLGVIADFETDPDKELRLRVHLPGVSENGGSVWARLACPDAGSERGYFFRPEPGDEVVVGFLADDPRYPVVLGALYGSVHPPPPQAGELDARNSVKAIVTRSGTSIRFVDDDKASLCIETPSKQKVLLDDEGELIEISDLHGNAVVMDSNGIAMRSSADLRLEAAGTVEIQGQQVDIQ